MADGDTAHDPVEDEVRALVRAALGVEATQLERLRGGGVGHRRFYRVRLASGVPASLVARVDRGDPAPGVPAEPPLEPLRTRLEEYGLPVPRRFGGDAASGIDLLEDVGDQALADAVAGASDRAIRALYAEACDWIPRLQRMPEPQEGLAAFSRALDPPLLQGKAERFARSGLPAVLGRPPRAAEQQAVRDAFAAVGEVLADAPRRLAHRDYQSRNLLVRTGAPAGAALAWIDVQGAFLAPPEYDLVCLLRDSYVVLDDALVAELAARTRQALPDAPDAPRFERRFDLLTVVRKAKDFALFHEVALRGDASWLRYAPASLDYVRAALGRVAPVDPRLARLARLLEPSACAR